MPQKGIASFFARAPAKAGAGVATGNKEEKENGPSTVTGKAETAAAKPSAKAQPKAASPGQDDTEMVPAAAAVGDGKKRKRLRQVIEDSPTKSDQQQEDLADDVPGTTTAAAAAPARKATVAATGTADAGGAASAQAGDADGAAPSTIATPMDASPPPAAAPKVDGAANRGVPEPPAAATATAPATAASADAAPAPRATAPAAASAVAASPKKIASIFLKPQPKPKATAAKEAAGTAAEAKAAANGDAKGSAKGKGSGCASKVKAAEDQGERGDKEEEEEEALEDEVEDDDEEEGAGPASRKSGKVPAAKKRKVEGSSKVDGVGLGAIAAAAKHGAVDTVALVRDRWKAGQPVPFEFLADTFETIAETSGRLDIIHLLVNCFRAILTTTPEDLLPTVYLCTNRVAPAHVGKELGVGESTLIKALSVVSGRDDKRIKEALREEGDLGTLAVKLKSTQRMLVPPPRLTIRGVFKSLTAIAEASGKDSQEAKKKKIVEMLRASKGNETGYVMRALQAKLRIGLAEQSVLVALAHAAALHRAGSSNTDGKLAERLEQAAQAVKQAYCECPSYDVIVPALLTHPISELHQHCHFTVGVPVKPMLAKATNAVGEVLDKFQGLEFTCEYKYDGERAQLHVLDDKAKSVLIFSRNSENNTSKYPDIIQRVHSSLKPDVKSIVIDSEAVAWDKNKKKILPFQVLSTRKRKDVEVASIGVQVCVFAFDCLYLNGRSLLSEPLEERRRALYSALVEVPGEMQFATAKTSKDVDELQRFLDEAVEGCTEGLIVKTLHDTYEPSRRSSHWLKLKKDYLQGVGDTFDVVPIGAWHGKGKRTGVYGAYLLAIYDPDSETYQTISKLGTGFSEEELSSLHERCAPHIIPTPRKYYQWHENLEPDVWFDALLVWEVKAADLSISPVHKAASGLVDPTKGISIRFPRLMRVRDDKAPEDATSSHQVADMFKKQAYHQPAPVEEDDDDA